MKLILNNLIPCFCYKAGTTKVQTYSSVGTDFSNQNLPTPFNGKAPELCALDENVQAVLPIDRFKLFGVTMVNCLLNQAVDLIMNLIACNKPSKIGFVNADCVNQYCSNTTYKTQLNNFDLVFADGVGVRVAANLQGIKVKDNVNGTDLFPLLLTRLSKEKKSVYFLGGEPGIAARMILKINKRYPDLIISGFKNGFDQCLDDPLLIKDINDSQADVVFVALGVPKQEAWISANREKLDSTILIGVGGLFDFYSGSVMRAPVFIRRISLEWVWRLLVQPRKKARRYLLGNPVFLIRALMSSLTNLKLNTIKS